MNPVKFNLNHAKEESTRILMIYRYNGKKLVMSTGITINTKHWNPSRQRVREKAGYFEYPSYNLILDNHEKALRIAEQEYYKMDHIPSPVELKEKIQNRLNGTEKSIPKLRTVYSYIKAAIEKMEELGKPSKSTINGYKQMERAISTFKDGRSIDFSDMSLDRLNNFTKHMVRHYDYGSSQINKIQRKLVSIVNKAKLEGYNINDAFYSKNWRVSESKINDSGIALTEDELQRIRNLELTGKLEKVRDRFLVGFSVGQRYGDFKSLNVESIITDNEVEFLNILQKKGNKVVKFKLPRIVKEVFNKYNGYPPEYSEAKFNKYIKEVCRLAQLNDEMIIRKENPIDGIVSKIRKKKYEVVSSHDCRRTFATLSHKKGVPLGQIMKVTGHSDLQTLTRYLKIDLNSSDIVEMELFIN